MSYYSINHEQNGIEIYFDNKPSENVRNSLKDNRWRWSGYKKCWYNFYSSDNLKFAKKMCGEIFLDENKSILPRKEEEAEEKYRPVKKQERIVEATDFIVRKSDLKCVHNEHEVEDVIAVAKLISPIGEQIEMKISAGHCKTCDVYYIMNSYFDVLRRAGVPICRVSDEKTYKKSLECGDIGLAAESLLMQYGYNVNQNEDLPDLTRQHILTSLIDNKIMRRTEIISYLDFFIEQRKGRSNFETAISKWEKDREFVANYIQSPSTEVRIRRLIK